MFLIDGKCDRSKWSVFTFDEVKVDVRNYLDDWMEEGDTIKYIDDDDDKNIVHVVILNSNGGSTDFGCTVTYIDAARVLKGR